MKFHLSYILLLLFLTQDLYSQNISDKSKPKIGLVLSGGGAKGLAHIGALKAIEEKGIHIDYIAGTSMGAIIGGLYASGYSAKQLDSIFQKTNFNTLIQDILPRASRTFKEREEEEKYAFSFPFDNFSVSLPTGISKGQNIYNLLAQITQHVETKDFSKLQIPFLCIATNIETGEEVILDKGNLAQAISASGAIPTLFRPVEINGQMLTDGGVINNYPIDKLKEKELDFIIGVDVQDSLFGKERLKTGLEIMTQVNNFRTIKDMVLKRKQTDIYIRPQIDKYNVLSFEEGQKIIKLGYEETLKVLENSNYEFITNNTPITKKRIGIADSICISDIIIKGNKTFPRNYIRGKLKIDVNKKIAYSELNTGLNNLLATGNFDRVTYDIIDNEFGKSSRLNINIKENDNKTYLRLAAHYDELYKSAILLNLTHKSLLFTNDAISLDLIFGDNSRFNFEYFIDKGNYWSLGLRSRFNHIEDDIDTEFIQSNELLSQFNVNQINLEIDDFTTQIYGETYLFKDFRFGLGLEHKYIRAFTRTFVENPNNDEALTILEKSNLSSAFGYLNYDSLDDKYFPTKGMFLSGDFNLYLSNNDITNFSIFKGNVGYVFSPLSKLSIKAFSELGFRLGQETASALDFYLGGFGFNTINNIRPFYGYNFLNISADSYIKGLVEVDYNFYSKNHFIVSANYANVEDNILETGEWFTSPNFSGYALGYGLDSIFGPLQVKYTYSPETKEGIWFFSLGFWF